MRATRGWRAVAVGCASAAVLAAGAAPAGAATNVLYFPGTSSSSLSITGEADDDLVTVDSDGTTITIGDQGTGGISTADADCANAGANAVTCPVDPPDPALPAPPTAPVAIVNGNLAGGADSFAGAAPFIYGVDGGDGDDAIAGGPRDDGLNGGEGNDQVLGGDGDDDLSGGGTIFLGGGTDLIDGQGGTDTAVYFRLVGVNVSLNGQSDDGSPGEGDNVTAENVQTGNGDDVVTGNPQANSLDTADGDDVLAGLEGNDTLAAGAGDDALDGGPQRDDLACDEGFDTGLVEPGDTFASSCERTGAEPEGGTATVNRRARARVRVGCPVEGANPCAGELALLAGSKQLGSARFAVGAGETGAARPRLRRSGRRLLARNGGVLLVTAEARTEEPIGVSVRADEVLLRRARGGKGRG